MHPNQKKKFDDCFVELDTPLRITVKFEHMNVLVRNGNYQPSPLMESENGSDSIEKLFVKKLAGIFSNLLKNPGYDKLSLGKEGYNKDSGEDCVERFQKEMLEIEAYMTN